MKTRQLSIMLIMLIMLIALLSGCTKTPTPQPKVHETPVPPICRATGETHTVVSNATEPRTQGSGTTFHSNVNGDGTQLHLAWTYCTGSPVFSSPVVQNGVVYIASTNTTLTALDIQSAKMLWQIQADDAFFGTPALQNGVLYADSLNGVIYAINAKDGFVRWHTQIDTPGVKIWSSPTIANGLLIIGAASPLSKNLQRSGQILAFDMATGKQRWRAYIEHGGKPADGVWSSPAIDIASNTVYVGTGNPDDGVESLNLRTGHLLWHWRSMVQDVGNTDVGAGPLLFHNSKGQLRVVIGGKNGNIYTLAAKTGHMLWHTHISDHVFSSPTFADGTLYIVGVVGQKATVWALDAQTGTARWHHDLPMIVYASPAILGQTLYLALGNGFESGDGGITVLNAANGQQIQYANMHSAASSSPIVLAAWLFVGAHNGNLYAFVRSFHS